MKNILLIGAGRSASTLIKYLLDNSGKENWKITVGDISLELAKQKIGNHPNAHAIAFDMNNETQRAVEIAKADMVISMLPATLHLPVAKECLKQKKNLVTASYVSKQMKELDADAKKAGVIFLNEIGLDPGIDHLSAMKVIDEVKAKGGKMVTFKSYCGGLVAPESNDNPWGYKFTWNPRAVVMAGQSGDSAGATAQYLENGKIKYVPYTRLFSNVESISVDGCGKFEAYANRDSLSYMELYGLHEVKNMLRGTLRMPGFCRAWNAFIQLGLTDDNCKVSGSANTTYAELIESFLPDSKGGSVKKKLAKFLHEKEKSPVMKKLDWLGIFKHQKIGRRTLAPSSDGEGGNASPAEILLDLLMKKWSLKPKDKDMVVMQHEFEYRLPSNPSPRGEGRRGEVKKITSSLVVIGDDQINTAMSKTVGLPLGISTKLILNGKINLKGVWIPTVKEIYNPVLSELEKFGIRFIEKHN
jgi:saccharopine dehydrogenase (NADP+, L-glutamate forming)